MPDEIEIAVRIDIPVVLTFEDAVTGQAAKFPLEHAFQAVLQAIHKGELAGNEQIQWAAIREYADSQFAAPVQWAEDQLEQFAHAVLAAHVEANKAAKKKAEDTRSSLISILASHPRC